MFLAVGVGAYSAAVFMVLCHAFYKGCLFLGAGSVIHGNGDVQDMRVMGRFRKFLPYTALAMVVAWLAIAGMPPFSGFFSKDEIITDTYLQHDYGLWIIALVGAAFTAIYMTRLIFMTFYGNERFERADADSERVVADDPDSDPSPTVAYGDPVSVPTGHPPHEAPGIMLLPVGILAVLAAVAGLLDVPLNGLEFLNDWLAPSFRGAPEIQPSSFAQGSVLEAAVFVLALAGLLLAYFLYRRGLASPDEDPLETRLGKAAPVFGNA